jgi:hypothetical protein
MKVVKVSNTLNRQEGSAVLIASVSLHIYLTLISVFGWVCDWVTLRATPPIASELQVSME